MPRRRAGGPWWTAVRDWAGTPLPAAVQARVARAEQRLAVIAEQIGAVEAQEAAAIATAAPESAGPRLVQLKALGTTTASVLLAEGLVWRAFQNRRQLGGILGFAPSHYASGEQSRDQGISRAGNDRLQSVMVQLAWRWVKWQPGSALTQWYQARFGQGARARKVGIVALARKLLIALWRWATQGLLPTGAILKAA